ncbi:nodulation protein NfeD [Aquibacillus sp. 3ASR75-11]|uniref:Nodulation protein NfeD n=1 Tax=Terrihalobacillus insolitus TaxID=2950438 RepID=A0A9X4AMK4_9BACI|nr:nodulation protein NfeD [Terrihalobacillus insolitus]MDC3413346.1 nodulation protein NfeD [Terrihalobacillus insolitus]MDC3424929.1 nodulation protein NfeD [Terrihalobacillus insolitus]
MKKRSFLLLTYFLSAFLVALLSYDSVVQAQSDGKGKLVYIIPIENTVERGLEAFLNRTTGEAVNAGADHIVFEINTPGGRVDSAENIAAMLQDLDIPTTSYIVSRALSAGSYIALNTDYIYMKPQATMGASGVINSDGTAANKKAQSAWTAAMKSAAESKGRDPLYAAAMADPSINLEQMNAPKGEFLTLGPTTAVEVGYAEAIVKDRTELLDVLGLSGAKVVEKETTLAEDVARFLTSPVVVPILLTIASIGFIIEFFSPGFGLPGSIGLLSLGLFFYGHFIAGLAGYEAIVLLVLGIGLIVAELFIPGGFVGIAGVGAIVASLFMSTNDAGNMAMSIGIAVLASILVSVILFKSMGMEKGFFRHFILKDATTTELGYVTSKDRQDLMGMEGIAATTLRPSGTGIINEERLDIVSEGNYIDKDARIKVVKTEGSRIVVRQVK